MNRTAEIATARKVDTEIARLWGEFHKVSDKIAPLRSSIKADTKSLKYYQNPSYGSAKMVEHYTKRIATCEAKIEALTAQAAPLREAARSYDRDNYTGWTRFFLVKHIHSSQHCSSFRITTRIGWLPDVSGLTEVEAVKEHGATLCTICFPSAPTELTTKAADPAYCTGTRDYSAPSRSGYYSGNWGTCTCGQRVTLTSAGNLRKHKTA